MKSKAPLAMMEQLVMVLVFALAAALCLQAFVLADRLSRRGEMRALAVTAAQNAAETLKHSGGDPEALADRLGGSWDGESWLLCLDENGQETDGEGSWQLRAVSADRTDSLLGRAEITAKTCEGDVLFTITVAWQEGMEDG